MLSPTLSPAPLAAAALNLTAVLLGLTVPMVPPALAEGTLVMSTSWAGHCSLFGGKGS